METQTAVVTGAASGIGATITRALHGAGFRVIITDVDEAGCYALAEELDLASELALTATLDVARPEDFQKVLDRTVDRWGSVEVLVNNAAVTRAQPVLDITPEDFNAVMAVNAGGTFAGSQIFARHFKDRGYGRIVNMASLAGQNGGTATGAHYAASKGAIMTLTKVFARDLAPFGITCNCISPGPMDSPMVHDIVGPDRMEGFLKNIPTGSLGDPAFVASLVTLLASPAASFVTGACWDVNGGLFMR
ncbi:SDR family NAD(P)-dependent oxidoreductase [Pseudooceanicola algae]|uniref:4-formylbenzenesulfonate dehydrogenase TsaC1/TsaC2 n=1 Tax=Pseudooceanicola algae TaxID=1537215 RepID=A0A418SH07_9RHOB|nr:SDR family NAD(P)-dependent oxidoreductase [Pseudooceanicola algae]QPM90338.1 4-formylbenzenesulfonate dehydrogenase TsaC1/TsaC2 [Pseudooceanicola algae]